MDQHIGKRLRARRLEIGMAQEELAELLGITFQQIQKYERGVNRIAASRLYEIAEAIDVEITYFFENVSRGGSAPQSRSKRPSARRPKG